MRTVKRLIFIYFLISVLSFVAVLVMAFIPSNQSNNEAIVHTFILAIMSLLLYLFAKRAAIGNEKALLRLRIVVVILMVALIVTACVLSIPLWLRVEHFIAFALLGWVSYLIFKKK